jgi:hypothetical protein
MLPQCRSMPLNAAQCRSQQQETGTEKFLATMRRAEDRKILEASVGTLQEDKAAAQRQLEHERVDDNSASLRTKVPRDGSSAR